MTIHTEIVCKTKPYHNEALNTTFVLLSLSIIGRRLFVILGTFLALPVAAVIPVVLKYNKN